MQTLTKHVTEIVPKRVGDKTKGEIEKVKCKIGKGEKDKRPQRSRG